MRYHLFDITANAEGDTWQDNHGNGGVSAQADELGSTLMGEALDRLAAGEDFSVVATAADSQGQRMTCEFDE